MDTFGHPFWSFLRNHFFCFFGLDGPEFFWGGKVLFKSEINHLAAGVTKFAENSFLPGKGC